MHLLVKVCLLLCVAGVFAKRHRPEAAIAREAVGEEEDQDRPPPDVIGDVALRDRLDYARRARMLRLLRLRRQQQAGSESESGTKPRPSQNAPAVASRGAGDGRAEYADEGDEGYGDDDIVAGDTLYDDDEEEDDKREDVRGRVGRAKGDDQRPGGRVRSSHRDPYTDVDDHDDRGGGNNYGADHRGENQPAEDPQDKGGAGAGSDADNLGSAKDRDDLRLRKRMDCIVDRVNHCIEWCRLKPTDTRLRQNRDNEPCRYWKGDSKNKWMQSGICRNGRCS